MLCFLYYQYHFHVCFFPIHKLRKKQNEKQKYIKNRDFTQSHAISKHK